MGDTGPVPVARVPARVTVARARRRRRPEVPERVTVVSPACCVSFVHRRQRCPSIQEIRLKSPARLSRLLRWCALIPASALMVAVAAGPASALAPPGDLPGLPRTAGDPADYAPVDRPGPALSVPAELLEQSLACSADGEDADRKPVLFMHGTTSDPHVNFGWNYQRAFDGDARPYCLLTFPSRGNGDIQVTGEYVVHAIRTMHELSGQRVDIIGWSQGGMIGRWATRFWPDTRPMVDDIVGLASSNHGANPTLCQAACSPAFWQQRVGSEFLRALNAGQETFAGISYTTVYSAGDQIVTPNFDDDDLTALQTGAGYIRNIRTQDVCPASTADHFTLGSSDPVGFAAAVDAIDNPGTADPARFEPGLCGLLVHRGVDPVTFPADLAELQATSFTSYALNQNTLAEPPVMDYVRR
jgi:pimeloyl-ACP methyl ester carboxylesterase